MAKLIKKEKETGIVERAKMVSTKPEEFFKNIKKEKGWQEAFKYFAVISLVTPLVYIIGSLASLYQMAFDEILFTYIFTLASIFVGAGIVHLFALLFKGKRDFSLTYKALAYGMTPAFVLGWIPVVGPLAGLYSLYLEVKGISSLHEMSMLRALAVVLIALFAIMAMFFAIVVGIFGSEFFTLIQGY